MGKKEPEPVKITKEDCYISEFCWDYGLDCGAYSGYHYPGESPVMEMHLNTGSGDRLRISTKNWKIDGDLRRISPKFDKPIKLTIEIPTLTDEEVAELEERARAKNEIHKLKYEVRNLQEKISRLEKKYQ